MPRIAVRLDRWRMLVDAALHRDAFPSSPTRGRGVMRLGEYVRSALNRS